MGDAAYLVDVSDTAGAQRLARSVRETPGFAGSDIVGGVRSVLVILGPDVDDPQGAADVLARLARPMRREERFAVPVLAPLPDHPVRTLVIPTVFDGPDLADVATAAGVDPHAVVAALSAAQLHVDVIGFTPGFAFLSGLPDFLSAVPRRAAPRPVVAAGSVALANGFAGVYPQATPGGWQLVGRTSRRLFYPATPPFAVLAPGDRVQFRPVADLGLGPAAPAHAVVPRGLLRPPGGAPAIDVEVPGWLTTVQDVGRVGLAHLGVPRAGPADPVSHHLANRLVGNPPGAPAVEVTALGPTLRFRRAAFVAVVGGGLGASMDGRELAGGRVVPVAAGQQLVLGTTRYGARGYLAVAGGVLVPPVMGSASSDILCGLGPGPLVGGDLLGIGPARGHPADHLRPDGLPAPGAPRHLRVLLGPDHAWFGPDLAERLGSARFIVGGDSNRVGIRLLPVDAASRIGRAGSEVESRGVVTGAVQIPPTGEPVVLLPDHATLGGYPVAAVVISADLGVLGQCRPGDEVRLSSVGQDEARRARAALGKALAQAVVGRYPVLTG